MSLARGVGHPLSYPLGKVKEVENIFEARKVLEGNEQGGRVDERGEICGKIRILSGDMMRVMGLIGRKGRIGVRWFG